LPCAAPPRYRGVRDNSTPHGSTVNQPRKSSVANPGGQTARRPTRRERCQVELDVTNVRINASGNPVKSVAHTLSGMASILRSLPKRVEYGEVDLPDLSALAALGETVDAALTDCVHRMRAERDPNGDPAYSWGDIGRALGTTRQAAQLRFGKGSR
jgi:hypothetical protein